MSSSGTSKRRQLGTAAAGHHAGHAGGSANSGSGAVNLSPAELEKYIEKMRVHQSAEEMAKMEAKHDENQVWIETSQDEVHSAVKRDKLSQNKCKLELSNGTVMEVEENQIEQMNAPKFDRVEDMSNLTYLNDPAVYHNLISRYMTNFMYTNSGISLIAINPYQNLGIYGKEMIEAFEMTPESQQPPHIYSIALKAYHNMMFTQGMNQSILCTGESGAGKTENCKQALSALIYLSVKNSKKIDEATERPTEESILEKQILASNPILESFGNAKTIKNDNSSRFGKFIQINYDPTGIIKSAKIQTYLLEKSRVTIQSKDERNFHIFYFACEGLSPQMKKECLLEDINHYKIVTNGSMAVRDINSKVCAEELLESLKLFNIEPIPVFKIISGILQIGNLEFEQTESAVIVKNDTALQKAAALFQVDAEMLKQSICEPTIKVGKEVTKVSQTANQCKESCRSMIRAIYENLFLYLVKRINIATRGTGISPKHTISLVDNAGFEIFEVNSLEQLAINNTNEKVQQFFNHHMFIAEQEEYAREKIEWQFTDYGLDLQPTIDLINGSPKERGKSLFGFINEFTLFSAMNDKQLNEKIIMSFADNEKFVKPKPTENHTFSLIHYAGKVNYTNDGWINKNKHPLHGDIVETMKLSKEQIIADMFKSATYAADSTQKVNSAHGPSRMRAGTLQTSLQAYTDQLNEVMSILTLTTPYFVRCIIPNLQKMPASVHYGLVKKQLQCNGVLEGIRIARKGFVNKVPYGTIKAQYHCLMPNSNQTKFADSKQFALDLMEYLQIDKMLWRAGVTKLFLKSDLLGLMEDLKSKMLRQYIEVMQAAIMKSYYGVMQNKSLFSKTAIETIRTNVKIWYESHRNNPWFKLVAKIKPTVQSLSQEQEARKLRDSNNSLNKKLEELSSQIEVQNELLTKSNQEKESNAAELEDLRHKYDGLTEEMNGAQSNLDQLAELVAHYEEDLNNAEETKSNLLNKIQDYESTLNLTTDQLNDAEANRQSIANERQKALNQIKELEDRIQELEDALSSAKSQINILESTNMDLKKEIESLKIKLQSTSRKSDEVNDALEEHNKELHVTKEQLAKVNSSNSSLKRELDGANETLQDLQDKFDRLTGLNDRNNKNLITMEESAQQLQKQKADIENELEMSKTNLEMLQEDYDSLKHKFENERKKVQDLEGQKAELSDTIMSSAEESKLLDKQMRSNLDNERAKNASLEEELDDLRKKSQQDLQQAKQEAAEHLSKMKEALNSSKAETAKVRSECEDLEDQLSQKKAQNTELSNLNNKLDSKVNELNLKLSEETVNNEAHQQQLSKLQSTHKATKIELDESKNELESTKMKLSELAAELASSSEQVKSLNEEKRRTKSKLSTLESDMETAYHELADVEEKKAQLEALHSQIVQKFNNSEQNVKDLTEENEEYEMKIKKLTIERDQLSSEHTLTRASLSKSHANLKHANDQIDNLEAEISQLKLDIESVKKSSKGSENEIKTLKSNNDQLEHNLSEANATSVRQESKINKLQSQLNDAEEHLSDLQTKNKGLERLLEEASSSSDIEIKLTKTLKDLNEKNTEIENLLADLDEQEGNASRLQSEVHQLRQKIQSNSQQFQTELQSRSDEYSQATQNLRQQLNETESRNVELIHKLKSINKDSKSSSQLVQELESQNAEMQSKIAALASSEKKLSSQLQEKESQNGTLTDELHQESLQRKDLLSKLSSSKKLIADLEMQVNKYKSEATEIRNEMADMSSSLDTAQSNEARYRRNANDAMSQLSALQEEFEDLEQQLNTAKTESQKFKQDSNAAKNELANLRDSLEGENQMLTSKLNSFKQSISDVENDANRLKQQLSAEKSRYQSLQSDYEEFEMRSKTESTKLNSKVKSTVKELEELRSSTAGLQEKIDKFSADNDKLKKDYRKIRMAYEESEKMNKQLRDNIKNIMNDMDN